MLAAKAPDNADVIQDGSPSPPAGPPTPSPSAPLNPAMIIATDLPTLKRKSVEEAGADLAPPQQKRPPPTSVNARRESRRRVPPTVATFTDTDIHHLDGLGLEAAMCVLENRISARIAAEIVTLLKHLNDTVWTPHSELSEVWYRKAASSRGHVLLALELAPMSAEEERGSAAALGVEKGKEKAVEPMQVDGGLDTATADSISTLIDRKLNEKLAPFMALMRKFQQGEK
ncbi:hypothetical protein OF83DRAFT_1087702 [Amylostereum chailletii]|nr:hypothetical protein OF83DRAFT_1087702 [Amylostereum chailletii]